MGLNWHLARGYKLDFNYEHTTYEGGIAGEDRPTETALLTRMQAVFRRHRGGNPCPVKFPRCSFSGSLLAVAGCEDEIVDDAIPVSDAASANDAASDHAAEASERAAT